MRSLPELTDISRMEAESADLEAEVVREAVTTNGGSPRAGGVVSLGGGAVMTPAVQEVLREHAEIPDGEGAIGHEVDEG